MTCLAKIIFVAVSDRVSLCGVSSAMIFTLPSPDTNRGAAHRHRVT